MISQSALNQHELLRYEELTDEDGTEMVCVALRSVWLDGVDQRFAVTVLTGDVQYEILSNEMINYFFDAEDADKDFTRVVEGFLEYGFGKGTVN